MSYIKDVEDILIRLMSRRKQKSPQTYFGLDIERCAREGAKAIAQASLDDEQTLDACEKLVVALESGNTTLPKLEGGAHA